MILKNTKDEKGATMVEFAICLIAFIMLVGGVFDLGLLVHKYSMLDNSVRKFSRDSLVRASSTGNCFEVRNYLRDEADEYLAGLGISNVSWVGVWKNRPGLKNREGFADETSQAERLGLRPSLHLTGRMSADCYFLCNLFPSGFNLSVSNEVTVDNQYLLSYEVCQDFAV